MAGLCDKMQRSGTAGCTPAKKVVYIMDPKREPNETRCANVAARTPRPLEPAAAITRTAASAPPRKAAVFQTAGTTQACGSHLARPAMEAAGFAVLPVFLRSGSATAFVSSSIIAIGKLTRGADTKPCTGGQAGPRKAQTRSATVIAMLSGRKFRSDPTRFLLELA